MYLKCTQTVYSQYLLTIMTLVIDADRNINYISNILLSLVEYTKYFHRLLSMIRVVWCFKQVSNDTSFFGFPAVNLGKKRKAEDEESAKPTKLTSKEVCTILPAQHSRHLT